MPRKAREKHSHAQYHIMCRSISETNLFREDADKDYYLSLVAIYTRKYKCAVYSYCLPDNHVHIHVDPRGYDISSLMHSINTAYVIYYNKKYDRHGPLFQGRFLSKIVDSDRYCLVLSAYIHNNAKDIPGYRGREEEYPYSSYGIYLGIRKDTHKLIDKSLIKGIFGIRNKKSFIKRYKEFVSKRSDMEVIDKEDPCEEIFEAKNEYDSGRRVIIRDMKPARVIAYIAMKLKKSVESIISTDRRQNKYRAFTAYVLRVLCGLRYKQICENIFNVTISGCSSLCRKGYELTERKGSVYSAIFNELLCANLY
ncbi:MAG: transposase [Acetivibrionales bacterium]|jgi:putative transposase|nr:transposase [Clostridiales bacterium]